MPYLVREPIDPAAAEARLAHRSAGGTVTFVGTIRDHNEGRHVRYLEYEAYEAMAEAQLAALEAALRERWPTLEVVLLHRVGRLEIGEVAVFVGVSAAHRDEAFAACRYGIEAIKADVAIWKREHFEGGSHWVAGCGQAHGACAAHP